MAEPPLLLFLDTGSPVTSVALGGRGEVLAERTVPQRRTSERLLAAIEEVLAQAGVAVADLEGVAALAGPGSFTGLRIGLATVMGLRQGLGVRATALPTLPVLALAAGSGAADSDAPDVLAAVDATRGDWVVQRFRGATPLAEPELMAAETLLGLGPARLVAFGAGALGEHAAFPGSGIELLEPPPLAAVAARRLDAEAIAWREESLTSPIYFRPPAVTLAKG